MLRSPLRGLRRLGDATKGAADTPVETAVMVNAQFYRICAIFMVAGGLIGLAANAIHPDLPIGVREAHALIASRADWRAMHLGIILTAMLLSYGFTGLTNACARNGAGGIERLALLSVVVGASVVAVSIGIDRFAEKTLSDSWANAPAAQRAQYLIAATPIQLIHVGLFYVWGGIFWGLSFIFYGWSMAKSRVFPAWFAWIAVASGALVCIVTAAQYLSPHDSVELAFRLLLFVEILWTLALGWFMWRLSPLAQTAEAMMPLGDTFTEKLEG